MASERVPPDVWLLAAITLIAALLRFSTITHQSFWVDEASTVHEVGLSLGGLWHAVVHQETTPPLYFLLAWAWTHLFGAGELGIRSLSALAGVLLVPVAYLCGRELVSRRAGVLTAALTAVSPFMIWYSQEARSYMLLALLCALSLLYLARATRTGDRRDLTWWVVWSALALATHFFAGFLIAPEGLWLIWSLRSRASVTAAGVAAVIELALVPLASGDTGHLLNWLSGLPLGLRIGWIPVQFGASQLYLSGSWPAGHGLLLAALLAGAVAALIVLGGGRRERAGGALVAALAACVVLVPLVLAEVGHDYLVPRNLMPAWIPLAILVAAACTAPRARRPGAALALVLLVVFVWEGVVIDGSAAYQRPDWRGVAAALGTGEGTRAIVANAGNAAEQPLAIYLPRTAFSYSGLPASAAPVAITEVDVVGLAGQPIQRVSGARLIDSSIVHQFLVARFALSPAWHLTPAQIVARAQALLAGTPPGAAVLIQPR
jgi:mannosyltransferase